MSALRCYTNWYKRPSDSQEQIEPYKKYFFICEGENTEVWYFRRIIDRKKQLGIHPLIDVRLMERTGEDESSSHPDKLLEFAKKEIKNPDNAFDTRHDQMVVVFDLDIFKRKGPEEYQRILEDGNKFILAVTNPCFELFLLLHFPNVLVDWIFPKEQLLLENKRVSNHKRYIDDVFTKVCGMNSKTNCAVGELADNLLIAIEQEQEVNQDISLARDRLTSNVGSILQMIREDSAT